MSTAARLRSARAALAAALVVRALLIGAATAGVLLALAALVDLALALPLAIRRWLMILSLLAGALTAAIVLWRGRRVRSLLSVALWLEERVSALEYALVTLIDAPTTAAVPALESRVAGTAWHRELRRAATRAVLAPVVAVVLVAAALMLVPRDALSRVGAPAPGDALRAALPAAASDAARSRLAPLVVTVVPPAYSGERRRVLDEPVSVAALVGSAIALRGRGRPEGIEAASAERRLDARADGDDWSIALSMPAKPEALRLSDGSRARLLVLDPRQDAPPVVSLVAPSRDSILREPKGVIALAAEVTDDIGAATASFEYIISSGSGESFTFRSGIVAPWRGSAVRTRIAGTLDLAALKLSGGDVVHLRAVAADGNVVTGPGRGASETRTIRVARADEYDSVAVEPAAPADAERSVLSQRMLLLLAEALERRRPRLGRAAVVTESRRIGADQTRLRRQVGELIFARLGDEPEGEHAHGAGEDEEDQRLEGKLAPEDLLKAADAATGAGAGEALDFAEGESPVVAINRPLLEAYNAMWDASRELDTGEPVRALPHMRAALAAIQRARQAERIYLRGRPATVVVDVARARLQGKEAGSPAPRRPRAASPDPLPDRAARFAAAVALLRESPAAGIDSLLLLRVESLIDAPSFARALGESIDSLRASRPALLPLTRARRALYGDAIAADSLGSWVRAP